MCRSLHVCCLNFGSRAFNALRATTHPHDDVGMWISMQAAAGPCSGPKKALSATLLPTRLAAVVRLIRGPGLAVPMLPWVLQPLAGSVRPTASRNMEATSKIRRLHRWPYRRG